MRQNHFTARFLYHVLEWENHLPLVKITCFVKIKSLLFGKHKSKVKIIYRIHYADSSLSIYQI